MGLQHIIRNVKKSPMLYLEYIHKTNSGLRRCYIGRARTTEEAMGEFEKRSGRSQNKGIKRKG